MPTQIIVSSRARLAVLLLAAIVFTVLAIGLVHGHDPRGVILGWVGVAFFGVLGIPALAFQYFRPNTLELNDEAVVMTTGFGKRFTVAWLDVDRFEVWSLRGARQAAYIYKPGRKPNSVLGTMTDGLGVDGAFSNSWPMSPVALTELLEQRRMDAEMRARA